MSIDHLHQHDGWHPLHCNLGSSSDIWERCLERNHNPCRALTWHTNVRADLESCHIIDSSGWMLGRDVFLQLEQVWGPFSINVFTSRMNAQLSAYCSWHPDPSVQTVDALSIPRRDHFSYMYQLWYSFLLRSLVELPVLFLFV